MKHNFHWQNLQYTTLDFAGKAKLFSSAVLTKGGATLDNELISHIQILSVSDCGIRGFVVQKAF